MVEKYILGRKIKSVPWNFRRPANIRSAEEYCQKANFRSLLGITLYLESQHGTSFPMKQSTHGWPSKRAAVDDQQSGVPLQAFQWGWKMGAMISEVSPALGFRGFYYSGYLGFSKWCEERFLPKNLSSLTLLYGKPNRHVFEVTGKRSLFSAFT